MFQKTIIKITLAIVAVAIIVGVGAYAAIGLQLFSSSSVPEISPLPPSAISTNASARPTQKPPIPFIPSTTPITTSPSPEVPRIVNTDPLTWPIERVCSPIQKIGDIVRDLKDGTFVYKKSNGTLFRGYANQCKCLGGDTNISTPDGDINVKNLRVGMSVYSLDTFGNKIPTPIIRVSRVAVPDDYTVSHLILKDDRELFASNAHPLTDGRTVGDLRTGDVINGSTVVSRVVVKYDQPFTYDILPGSSSGSYWANGILLKSTISR